MTQQKKPSTYQQKHNFIKRATPKAVIEKDATISDIEAFKQLLHSEVIENNAGSVSGVTFKGNRSALISKHVAINSAINRHGYADVFFSNEEALHFIDVFSTKMFEIKNRVFAPMLYYMHLCLSEFTSGLERDMTLSMSCDFDRETEEFDNFAMVTIKMTETVRMPLDAKNLTYVFSNIANFCLMQFSTKQVQPKIQTIHNGKGVYHYSMTFQFNMFTFLKRMERKRFESCVAARAKYPDFDQSCKQWIRKFDSINHVRTNQSKQMFIVDEHDLRKLSEYDKECQYIHKQFDIVNDLELNKLFEGVFAPVSAARKLKES